MARVKGGMNAKRRHNKVLKLAKGYFGSKHRLYKTAKDFKSDIAGFGRYALPKYSTWNDWTSSDWLNNYQNAFFKVNVETEIQGGYLFTKI